jgi:hypothetical protein
MVVWIVGCEDGCGEHGNGIVVGDEVVGGGLVGSGVVSDGRLGSGGVSWLRATSQLDRNILPCPTVKFPNSW